MGGFMVKKYTAQGSENNEAPGIDMALLPGYKVKKTTGPDFNVYYVYKTIPGGKDAVAEMGIYFGEHPNTVNQEIDESRITKENVVIDGENVTWFVWTTDDSIYHREVLLRDWPNFPNKIHIFITSKEQEEMGLLKTAAEKFQ